MAVASGDTVSVHYTGTLEDGTTFDSSEGRAPLLFTLGAGDVIPGFEQAVIGLEIGEKATVTIQPEDAYGPVFEEAIQTVPVDLFGEAAPPVGAQFSVRADDDSDLMGRVVSLSEDLVDVTVDFNHPLAGKVLTFDIELVELVTA
jgi:peptidylprolyl isomerase